MTAGHIDSRIFDQITCCNYKEKTKLVPKEPENTRKHKEWDYSSIKPYKPPKKRR